MVQNQVIHIDVAFLTFNPKLCLDTPCVKQDAVCLAGQSDLRRHRDHKRKEKATMGADAYKHYKWYSAMLMHEIKAVSENVKLSIVHWHIESGNTEAFMMGGVLYKAVSIIIGSDMEHWFCANTGKDASHSHGSRYRKNDRQHEENTEKMACFTIDDNEATLVFKPSNGPTKCSTEICANNCIECKKFRSPFTKTNSISQCVCYPSREEFKSFVESDLEDDSDLDPDIAHLPSTFFERRGQLNRRFQLNAIREESITN